MLSKRAYQLARSGSCNNVIQISRRLKMEGYSGPTVERLLRPRGRKRKCGHVKADPLAFVQSRQPGALDGTDMEKTRPARRRRLNEAEALCRVEPFHFACWHRSLLSVDG